MLVPLQTLPGWPAVEDPSLLMVLALFLGLPVATLLVIFLIAQVPRLVARGRGEVGPEIDHPLSIYGVDTVEQYRQLGQDPARPVLER